MILLSGYYSILTYYTGYYDYYSILTYYTDYYDEITYCRMATNVKLHVIEVTDGIYTNYMQK